MGVSFFLEEDINSTSGIKALLLKHRTQLQAVQPPFSTADQTSTRIWTKVFMAFKRHVMLTTALILNIKITKNSLTRDKTFRYFSKNRSLHAHALGTLSQLLCGSDELLQRRKQALATSKCGETWPPHRNEIAPSCAISSAVWHIQTW